MKHAVPHRILALSLASVMLLLAACNTAGRPSGDTTDAATEAPTPTSFSLIENRKLLYSLIRGEDAPNMDIRAAMLFRDSIIPFLDDYPLLIDDWDYKDDNAGELKF